VRARCDPVQTDMRRFFQIVDLEDLQEHLPTAARQQDLARLHEELLAVSAALDAAGMLDSVIGKVTSLKN